MFDWSIKLSRQHRISSNRPNAKSPSKKPRNTFSSGLVPTFSQMDEALINKAKVSQGSVAVATKFCFKNYNEVKAIIY